MRAKRVLRGHPVTRKLNCQVCKAPKEEGLRCEDCGFPNISITLSGGKTRISFPLCPSTNDRMRPIRMGRYARDILTEEARDYMASVAPELKRMLTQLGIKPRTSWVRLKIWTVLPNRAADCHNYGKVLFDAMEDGGYVTDDKLILPYYQIPTYASKPLGISTGVIVE